MTEKIINIYSNLGAHVVVILCGHRCRWEGSLTLSVKREFTYPDQWLLSSSGITSLQLSF